MKKKYQEILRQYFSNGRTSEGKMLFQRWFAASGEDTINDIDETEKEVIRDRIEKRLHATIRQQASNGRTVEMPRVAWTWYAAASIVIVLSITYVFLSRTLHRRTFAQMEEVNTSPSPALVTLPDGSMVKLKSNSRIRFPEQFAANRREVFLEGEAFFEVVRDTNRMFIVSSGAVRTKVLGTSFNIRAYPGQATVEVLVATGKVAVEDTLENTHITLLPMQRAVYEQRAGVLRKDTIPQGAQPKLSGREGDLIIKDMPLRMVTQLLHQRYGVTIVLENDTLRTCKVSLTSKDKTVHEIIADICVQLDVKFLLKDEQYFLNGNGCQQ